MFSGKSHLEEISLAGGQAESDFAGFSHWGSRADTSLQTAHAGSGILSRIISLLSPLQHEKIEEQVRCPSHSIPLSPNGFPGVSPNLPSHSPWARRKSALDMTS